MTESMVFSSYQPARRLVPHRETLVPNDRTPLWDPDGVDVHARKPTIEEKFLRFHAEHPEVYQELVRLARQAKQAGRDRVGIKMLMEVVRWGRFIESDDAGPKLNNVFSSRYARLIQSQEPDLASIFETRRLLSN